jgi:arylsulfatase A-like enzyme
MKLYFGPRLLACFVFVGLFGKVSATAAPADRPNIIFILADDLGWADLGCYGSKFYETPNLDALAKSGMRFTQAYAACCVCSPTRASIMTGKYPVRTGITDYIGGNRTKKMVPAPNQDHLALEEVTIAEALREGGYTNFFAGKWHLGAGEYSPNAQGFGPGLMGNKGQFFYPGSDQPPDAKDDPKTTDRIASEAIRFIEANKDRPFFAYMPFLAVHIPIGARKDLIEKYERKRSAAPDDTWGKEGESKVRLVQNHAAYAAMLEQLDSAIGRVLATVDRLGLAKRTIILFNSDNGGLATAEGHPTSNLPLRGGKGWPYEGGIREPLLVRWPGVTKAGSVCDAPMISTDYYPTMLAMAGLPLRPAQHLDGVSLARLLRGGKRPERALFWHYPHYGNQGGSPVGTIRKGDLKMIEWYEDMRVELYDVKHDLGEKHDLAATHPRDVDALRKELHAWREEVRAKMPTIKPVLDKTTN